MEHSDILLSDKAKSLLPVGLTQVIGKFKKGDIIRIVDEKDHEIGLRPGAIRVQKSERSGWSEKPETYCTLRSFIFTLKKNIAVLESVFKSVKEASRKIGLLPEEKVNQLLISLADKAEKNIPSILEENKKDLVAMPESDPKYDRLKLTEQRIRDIASDIRKVSGLPSPLGITLEKKVLGNGLRLEKITVPLGVIGIIYEARPNVTFDVFALCLKSGNACILKGGSDAENSNKHIVSLIKEVLQEHGESPDYITLLPSDRSATQALLHAVGYVDIIIPRGSQHLIDYVRDNSRYPSLKLVLELSMSISTAAVT